MKEPLTLKKTVLFWKFNNNKAKKKSANLSAVIPLNKKRVSDGYVKLKL